MEFKEIYMGRYSVENYPLEVSIVPEDADNFKFDLYFVGGSKHFLGAYQTIDGLKDKIEDVTLKFDARRNSLV